MTDVAPTPLPEGRSSQGGFTLLEVLVALTIMSLVMVALYSVLQTTLRTRDMLNNEVRAASAGPSILDTIERDLRRAWVLNLQDDKVFIGEDRTVLGEPADSLVFVSSVGSSSTRRVGEHEAMAELVETGYRLRVNPDLPDVLELWRRQDYHLDEEPLEDGSYERLHDRVVGFDLQYYADLVLEHDPVDDWDAEELHALPAAIKVRLGIEVAPRMDDGRRELASVGSVRWYERVIVLDSGLNLAMRVHPYVPSLSGAIASSGGSGSGGEDGERDGEGKDGSDDPFGSDGGNGGQGGGDSGGSAQDFGDLLDELFGGGGG